ncbi:MAG: GH3 auxin-responsive promoter family protein [Candidatus Bathyarchaeia archaeon]
MKVDDFGDRQRRFLDEKLDKQRDTNIGKKLGIGSVTFSKLPLTSYSFYKPFFESPVEADLLHPLDRYVKAYTSGTMGKPKGYLLPMEWILDNLRKTALTGIFLFSHDGSNYRFEVGDVIYRNSPGGSFISGFMQEELDSGSYGFVKQVPDDQLPFKEKVEYFIDNHDKIDLAYMNVPILLEEMYPQIGEALELKGFFTQDSSSYVFRDEIRDLVGTPPKVFYGSTETNFCGLPSIEYPGAFFFDWRVVYPEFLPEDEAISEDLKLLDDPPETLQLTELRVGEKYQLIATPYLNDLTRYLMPDILKCIDDGDDILGVEAPIFLYYARCDRLISLHNFTRISYEELLTALRDADIPFVDFTARKELTNSYEYLKIYMEVSEQMSAEEVTQRLHEQLMKLDRDWMDLTNFMGYRPLKVEMLRRGTFNSYLQKRKGLPKITHIGMKHDQLELLLRCHREVSGDK